MKMKIILPKIHFEFEHWKWNNNYNMYVSNLGNLKNAFGEVIEPKVGENGYMVISDYYGKWIGIHRLVMKTFKPISNEDTMTVDHLDHNKRNNKLSNLEWVTREENLKRANNDIAAKDDIVNLYASEKVRCFGCNLPARVMNLEEAVEFIIKRNPKGFPSANKIRMMKQIWECAQKNGSAYSLTWTVVKEEIE